MNSTQLKEKIITAAGRTLLNDFQLSKSKSRHQEPMVFEDDTQLITEKTEVDLLEPERPVIENLEFANEGICLLYDMLTHQDDMHSQIEPGSIVVTDFDTFYVSEHITDFQTNGKKMFGLSTQSSLYQKMKGKRKGDAFNYKGMTYTIREIF